MTQAEQRDLPPARNLTVQDVATDSGVAPSAVRFYERYSVIAATRTTGNQRRFDETAACRIKVAKLAQNVGLTVREIAAVYADLPADPEPEDWGRVAKALIEEAERRTAQLKANLAAIGAGNKMCEVVDRLQPGPNAL